VAASGGALGVSVEVPASLTDALVDAGGASGARGASLRAAAAGNGALVGSTVGVCTEVPPLLADALLDARRAGGACRRTLWARGADHCSIFTGTLVEAPRTGAFVDARCAGVTSGCEAGACRAGDGGGTTGVLSKFAFSTAAAGHPMRSVRTWGTRTSPEESIFTGSADCTLSQRITFLMSLALNAVRPPLGKEGDRALYTATIGQASAAGARALYPQFIRLSAVAYEQIKSPVSIHIQPADRTRLRSASASHQLARSNEGVPTLVEPQLIRRASY